MISQLRDFARKNNNNKDSKLLFFILSPAVIPHEFIHYLTGKALGLETKMELTHVNCHCDHDWQRNLVTITPTIFALLILLISQFLPYPASRITYLYGVSSLLICYIDVLDLLYRIKEGRLW